MNQNFIRIKQDMRRVLLVFDYARRDKPSTSAHAKHFLSRLPNRLGDDIRIPRVQNAHAGHSVISTARRTQVHVVTGVMVHAGFRQHGVVFDFGFTQRRHVVRDENEFSFPRADGFENRLVPKLFYVKEQKTKNTRVRTDVERRVNAEREREKRAHQGPPKSFPVDPKGKEREIQKQIKRTVYFPDRITTCKRLLIPSCAFFDETLDDIMNLCFYFAFLSSDAANVFMCSTNDDFERREHEVFALAPIRV